MTPSSRPGAQTIEFSGGGAIAIPSTGEFIVGDETTRTGDGYISSNNGLNLSVGELYFNPLDPTDFYNPLQPPASKNDLQFSIAPDPNKAGFGLGNIMMTGTAEFSYLLEVSTLSLGVDDSGDLVPVTSSFNAERN